VWFESVVEPQDVALDRSLGLNTYVELTDTSDLSLLRHSGMSALVTRPDPLAQGYVLADEVDMWAGPGDGDWTGEYPGGGAICAESSSRGCGFTVLDELRAQLPAGLVYANYGKGVTFWHGRADAAIFVNRFQDVVSADNYWFTDPNICSADEGGAIVRHTRPLEEWECRRAANYGWTVDQVRSLVDPRGSKPVWAFVEVGHPFEQDDAPTITGPQVRAAVWSSLIHGARGIVYFNHSFGGPCETQHVLRDACGDAVRPWVHAVNAEIRSLAPALNAPFLDDAVVVSGDVDTAVKVDGRTQYLFAAATSRAATDAQFTLRCAGDGTVTVLGEDRELQLRGGVFTDHFEDSSSVHLYRYRHGPASAPGCDLP